MVKRKATAKVQVPIRMLEAMRAKLAKSAKGRGVSLNAEIVPPPQRVLDGHGKPPGRLTRASRQTAVCDDSPPITSTLRKRRRGAGGLMTTQHTPSPPKQLSTMPVRRPGHYCRT